MGQNSQFPAMN